MFSSAVVNVAVRCALSALARRVVCHHRVVEDQRVDELRRRRGDGPCFERAVIEVVRAAFPHRLRVGVGKLGAADEDLAGHRADRAESRRPSR